EAAPDHRRLGGGRPRRRRPVPPGADRPRARRPPPVRVGRAAHPRAGLPLLARVRDPAPPGRPVAPRDGPGVRRRTRPRRVGAPVRRRVRALQVGGQPARAAPGRIGRGVRGRGRRLPRQMPRPARHLRHGRGDDQRTRMGLLPGGAGPVHLPVVPPGRHRRRPGHPVALGRPRTHPRRPARTRARARTGGHLRMTDTDRLRRLLGGPDTAWLVKRVRSRLERGASLSGRVTLAEATPAQRRAVELLLGRRAGTGASLSVPLDEVDRVLRTSGASPHGLAAAVELLDGPVRDLARENAETAAAWAAAFAPLDEALTARPELAEWRAWLDSTGLVRRLAPDPAEAAGTLRRLAAVVRRLPSPDMPLGRFAAETCGHAHALDEGPLATLALSSARALAGLPFRSDGGAEARRETWAKVGVHLDELSSTVLCLGLPGDAHTPTGRMLAAMR